MTRSRRRRDGHVPAPVEWRQGGFAAHNPLDGSLNQVLRLTVDGLQFITFGPFRSGDDAAAGKLDVVCAHRMGTAAKVVQDEPAPTGSVRKLLTESPAPALVRLPGRTGQGY